MNDTSHKGIVITEKFDMELHMVTFHLHQNVQKAQLVDLPGALWIVRVNLIMGTGPNFGILDILAHLSTKNIWFLVNVMVVWFLFCESTLGEGICCLTKFF